MPIKTPSIKPYYDVVIIGAGPVGLAFALSLKQSNLNILLVERAPLSALENPKDDGREVALTHSSIKILSQLGAWDLIDKSLISPLKRAQVFNGTDKTPLDFSAEKSNIEALGYLVANYAIRASLFNLVAKMTQVDIVCEAEFISTSVSTTSRQTTLKIAQKEQLVKSQLLIAADSRMSSIRTEVGIKAQTKDFKKTMIVCRMQHDKPHNDIAYEYFYQDKTLALLPLKQDTCSVVITLTKTQAEFATDMSEADFNQYLSQEFAHELGQMQLISKRYTYPLLGVMSKQFIASRCALIGDAAVGMHPVTAHGFNLGLQGQAILAKALLEADIVGMDVGSQFVLKAYQTKQKPVSNIMYFGTNSVVALFANDAKVLKPVRALALKFAQKFPPIHYAITQHLTQTKDATL